MTAEKDTIRKPYAREPTTRARTTSICGTTNKSEFLNDETGYRRWWVIHISGKIDLDDFATEKTLSQFWAQCYAANIRDPCCFRLTDGERKQLEALNQSVTEMLPAEDELRIHWSTMIREMQFLSAIDTGICDIYYEKIENRLFFFTKHKDSEGNEYSLELYNESAGTIKSIDCFIFAQAAVMMNKSLFIDELNIKLHPLLLKFIVDLFYEKDTTAQLIYTTHDTTLMDRKFFRRDQIWFVQKNQGGCSDLCALSDYKVRSDASFEKDYLAGVYGGIPLLKEFQLKGDPDNGNG